MVIVTIEGIPVLLTDFVQFLETPLFSFFGAPVSRTEALGFASGALCVWLVARQHIANWPLGIANCLLFVLLFTQAGLYADAGLQFVFIALGSPQQEMIAHEIMKAGDAVGVAVCCSAALDCVANAPARAPAWMRSARLEWLHGLTREPGLLWRRGLLDAPRFLGIWRRWAMAR